MATNSRFAVAVHILALLAQLGALTSDAIATSVNTHPVVVRRILAALAKAGLVTSQTGVTGGSRLAHDPEQISLLAVYRAVACGKLFALHPQPPNPCCPVGARIETVLEDVLGETEIALDQVFTRITIGQILRSVHNVVPASEDINHP